MNTQFRMQTRKSRGNLHVQLEGIFDQQSASSLAQVLREAAAEHHRMFINTDGLAHIEPPATEILHAGLKDTDVNSRIYFKGKKGRLMAMEGHRVIKSKPLHRCNCSGKCKVCKCVQGKENSLGRAVLEQLSPGLGR
ncbi:hypothetical protein SAMN05660653_03217 [Desulfonatronum thiosulfatophilum]|uniref:Uncharacterized protein n=1 Tax=Desulfonatronum thiosulfatophilum TaxID=617002 RepID=A0A1G6EW32_9BACT|nr:hypothetical protein [Desulfonatronum thiosulfatophilum]SDB61623.1 hypothetical protein SAMN05660653_03217 [Desulfonatronum thiosulfatophilum]